ncbi:MAG: hypothetical protein Q7R96_06255 [Nanoarchaeota archaeon]|nr:hypothetical protein [Nanoarchaeota archaeon]
MRWLIIIALVVLAVLVVTIIPRDPAVPIEVHDHADFLVVIDNVPFNFSQPQFMSDENHSLNPVMHVHGGIGWVMHKHAAGVALNAFFRSVNMSVNNACLVIDGVQQCGGVRLFVNGREVKQVEDYVFADLDHMLILVGPSDPAQWLGKVSDDACIYSGTCPERGVAPDEVGCGSTCFFVPS